MRISASEGVKVSSQSPFKSDPCIWPYYQWARVTGYVREEKVMADENIDDAAAVTTMMQEKWKPSSGREGDGRGECRELRSGT